MTRSFVRHWQLLGPLPNPENGRDVAVSRRRRKPSTKRPRYDGIDGKVRWRQAREQQQPHRPGPVLRSALPGAEPRLRRLLGATSSRLGRPVLATGSDDGIKVWINRELKLDKAGQREALPGSDEAKIELREGWNEILVKVDNRFGRWGFYLELRDPETGRPLENIEYRIDPPPPK